MSEKHFIDGVRVYQPHENAPDFIKNTVDINLSEIDEYLRNLKAAEPDITNLRFDIKESKGGKLYAERNTFKPKPREQRQPEPQAAPNDAPASAGTFDEDIPFAQYMKGDVI